MLKAVPSVSVHRAVRKSASKTQGRFIEPNDGNLVENADNLTVAPWGDLIVCEDGPGDNGLVGVTPQGELYKLARNVLNHSELAGAVFSPDGTTLFVNIQRPGLTLAITGPWLKLRAAEEQNGL
jgi:secreted PhoX family phosphatase